LKDRGVETIERLSSMSVDELVDAIDVSFDQANEILERAHRLLAQKHAREAQQGTGPLSKEGIEGLEETAEEAETELSGEAAEAEEATEAETLEGKPVIMAVPLTQETENAEYTGVPLEVAERIREKYYTKRESATSADEEADSEDVSQTEVAAEAEGEQAPEQQSDESEVPAEESEENSTEEEKP
jgi:hypothetical protein